MALATVGAVHLLSHLHAQAFTNMCLDPCHQIPSIIYSTLRQLLLSVYYLPEHWCESVCYLRNFTNCSPCCVYRTALTGGAFLAAQVRTV